MAPRVNVNSFKKKRALKSTKKKTPVISYVKGFNVNAFNEVSIEASKL